MQRLILAAIIAYLLLPEEFAPQSLSNPGQSTEISTADAMNAAQDVLDDLGAFCERNADACETGGALISGARQKVLEGLEAAPQTSPQNSKN